MKNNKSLKQVKKLLKGTQITLEKGLRKRLTVYDNIKDEKDRKKAKSTFLLSYKSIFNDSINTVIAEVCRNKRLAAKVDKSGLTNFGIARKSGLAEEDIKAAIDGIITIKDEHKEKIAKVLGCKRKELFD